jgi:two-component system, chemotaxis family, sensor kinase CheA
MIHRLLRYLVLPAEISKVERQHLARINRIALVFFLCHFPVLVLVAALNDTRPFLAAELCALTLFGPLVAYKTLQNPRQVSLVFGITSMFMGGLLVHFGQGPMQIEMHFYFFVSLALMAVFANPMIIVASAITVALHHLVLFLILPSSVFNYEASFLAVGVHFAFVVLESIAACFVARSFFDNVVGLEKVVDRRTEELRSRNSELKAVLDNVGQGFLTADQHGLLASEHSRSIEAWLGPPGPKDRVWDYFEAANEEFGRALKAGWANLPDNILSQDVILDSLPRRMSCRGREFLCEYRPIALTSSILIVVSDITGQLEKEQLEAEQRETVRIFQNITNDRVGCEEFVSEANELVEGLKSDAATTTEIQRAVHTLKGNASLFGISSLERACHAVEVRMNRAGAELKRSDRAHVIEAWERSAIRISQFLGGTDSNRILVEEDEYLEAISAIRGNVERPMIAQLLETWRYEAASQRLGRIADQAKSLANRLGKGPIEVKVQAGRLRLPQAQWSKFWAAFAHVVRNAVDHGLEEAAERLAAGKRPRGCIRLSIARTGDQIRLTATDDGRGIAWHDLQKVAAAAGLPAETPQHLVEAMFVDGITTRKEASEISGQGIGMGAIRAACHMMGGTIQVTSEPGLGTQLLFLFPLTTVSVPFARSLAQPSLFTREALT